jgi:small subunit ribosomal protein S21|tara:strand:- start:155 stop:550 length:396 start_codon:yes stop_codon:yes gene_type:complete
MKNTNWSKSTKEGFNKTRKPFHKPQEKQFRGASVEVRNDDVAGAIRRLKKILERDDRQKDLAKQEFYEKPSAKRKRKKAAAKSRWNREVENKRRAGTWIDSNGGGTKWMKTKKKRRAHEDLQKKIKSRGRG